MNTEMIRNIRFIGELAKFKIAPLRFVFTSLKVLEGVIKYHWNVLFGEQHDGIKNYISDLIVQVLKHEWPSRWPGFIPDLVVAAKSSETIYKNCMSILKLLSEEVFDFSRGEMTQQKIKELKQSLNNEFHLIHELCIYVLSASQRSELIRATLATLHAFLSWIPLGYIFESILLETLIKLFLVAAYRNSALQCLIEVASLNFGDYYNAQFVKLYTFFMIQLQSILLPTTNIPEAYANGSDEEQLLILSIYLEFGIILYFIFKNHIRVLESSPNNTPRLLTGLKYLINISYIDDNEVFKVCLDYWNALVSELFEANHSPENPVGAASMMSLQVPYNASMIDGQIHQHKEIYSVPMSKLRMLMICQMAKPEEVLIMEDENGNIVRETMKDNDVLVQYKIM